MTDPRVSLMQYPNPSKHNFSYELSELFIVFVEMRNPVFEIYTDKHNYSPCFLIVLLSYNMFRSHKATVIS
jgi:hypothetical protein